MNQIVKNAFLFLVGAMFLWSCGAKNTEEYDKEIKESVDIDERLNQYTTVRLEADLSHLNENQKQIISLLIEASKYMDEIFWMETYGDKDSLLALLDDAPKTKEFAEINYGPWDRIQGNEPFIQGYGEKPAGANFYPKDMTKEEFESLNAPGKESQYTILKRDENGEIKVIPYYEAFENQVVQAAKLLHEASLVTDNPALKEYLQLRADAFKTDIYQPSDMAWMDMKDNEIDAVIGPIENYEDELFNYKSAHEGIVLVKDMEWSDRLSKYTKLLPELQRNLPVEEKYKLENPGTNSDLNAYDVVYYAGDANAGPKSIAINLPNDEEVQLQKGSRRLQLKNVMRAKFDKILVPLADVLIDEEQREHITFDAFFANTMFHEVAHGLGIKNVIEDTITVRRALKEHYSAVEEGKADILGLYMVTYLLEKGELEGDIKDYYTTFLASIFRSIRFGAAEAHGKANMARFNFFKENGAFDYDESTRTYKVNYDKMKEAVNALSERIIVMQGEGDYEAAGKMLEEEGVVSNELQLNLNRLKEKGIPKDVVFEQGVDVLGLE